MDGRATVESATPPEPKALAHALEELEPLARRLARRWARHQPDAEDDLAQVARVAFWQLLKRRPDAPLPHLVQDAKQAIQNERIRGRSVDGRLNPITRRPKTWVIHSLEALTELLGTNDILMGGRAGDYEWYSPVELDALGRLLYQDIRRTLTPLQDAYLALLLLGYRHKDAGVLLGLSKQQVYRTHQALRCKAARVLELERDGTGRDGAMTPRRAAAQRAAQARWGRCPDFSLPAGVAVLLALFSEAWDASPPTGEMALGEGQRDS